MNKLLLILGVLTAFAATVIVIHNEGVIVYETKINMHRNIPADRQEMKGMVPEYQTSEDQLLFNDQESLYIPVEEEPDLENEQRPGVRMRMQRPKTEVYLNRNEAKRITLQEFMGKKYLIEDSLRMRPWKISSETKVINGYSCRKATLVEEEGKMNVVAWYSDQFRPFLGPENFNSLPGAVLLVEINEGERIITAKSIHLRPLGKNELKVPSAKTRTTEAEYRKMVKEQVERMRANGANVIIRN